MLFSAYQIESMLEDFHKNISTINKPKSDILMISKDAYNEARKQFGTTKNNNSGWVFPKDINKLVEDQTKYDPIVDHVQQSRAGRFVFPNFVPGKQPSTFPLVTDFSKSGEKIVTNTNDDLKNKLTAKNHSVTENKLEENIEEKIKPSSLRNNTNNSNYPQKREKTEINDQTSKEINLDIPIKTYELESTESITKIKEKDSAKQLFGKIDLEEDEEFTSFSGETTEEINDYNDVVFGEGPIKKNSISKFVINYPESAITFLLRKKLDGRPLPIEYEKIYEKWENRGLSKGRLKKYLFKLMQWEEFPDIPVIETLKIIKEHIFDVKGSK